MQVQQFEVPSFKICFAWALLCTVFLQPCWSEEIGHFGDSSFLLQPQLKLNSDREGGFAIGTSSYQHTWKNQDQKVVLGLGTQDFAAPGILFNPAHESEITLSDFYWDKKTSWGGFRVGYQPSHFSLEGGGGGYTPSGYPLSVLSYALREHWLSLRHMGVDFRLSSDGFFTNMMIYNGEGLFETDNFQWIAGQWGFASDNGWQGGIGGMAGGTNPASTGASLDTLWHVTEDARHRWGHVFVQGPIGSTLFRSEAYIGSVVQGSISRQRNSWYVAFHHHLIASVQIQLMYEEAVPDDSLAESKRQFVSLILAQWAPQSTAQTLLLYRHQLAADLSPQENQVQLIWRISPRVLDATF